MNFIKACCFFVLSVQFVFADNHKGTSDLFAVDKDRFYKNDNNIICSQSHHCKKHHCTNSCQLGTASFSTTNPAQWYIVNAPAYPNTAPLSLYRNGGFTEGDVRLTSTGLKIRKSGNYSVNFSAFLLNNDPINSFLFPVFLVPNGVFDPTNTSIITSLVSLTPGLPGVVQATGILKNVKAGTKLSLVVTNGSTSIPVPVTVIAWSISLFKIPCDS